MVASRWLPGRTIGPFRYEDVREDDPNDVIPHEDRRDLRGARVIAAWLAHYDSREQNTMTTWEASDAKAKDSSPGRTTHWYIDLGDCFGTHWEWESWNRRLNHSYYFDIGDIALDFVTIGALERPWDHPVSNKELPMFDYFHPELDPDDWKGGYPNPAFARMTELDAAWAARIVARFTDSNIAAAVKVGDYTDPRATAFLTNAIIARRDAITRRYFAKKSPLADLAVEADDVCAIDLARKLGTSDAASFTYAATLRTGDALERTAPVKVRVEPAGKVCVTLPRTSTDESLPRGDARRYAVLDLTNGIATGPLRVHLYDLGSTTGYRLAGVQRPDSVDASVR